jgi:DNA/RNA-binding domain of Phe-tRNA-synthetase-like protein
MELKQIQISGSLEDIARVGVVLFKQVTNGAASADLENRFQGVALELRQAIGERPLSELESVRRTRRLFHRLGVDPTRERPSSERLLRRVMQNRPLPRISRLVDAVNLASLLHQCPIGVYDWDRIVPPILLRIGRPEESYIGISGETVALEGRIALVDGEGLFGNPAQDSPRALVSIGTVRAAVIAWASIETPKAQIEDLLKEVIALAKEFCEARVGEWGILG